MNGERSYLSTRGEKLDALGTSQSQGSRWLLLPLPSLGCHSFPSGRPFLPESRPFPSHIPHPPPSHTGTKKFAEHNATIPFTAGHVQHAQLFRSLIDSTDTRHASPFPNHLTLPAFTSCSCDLPTQFDIDETNKPSSSAPVHLQTLVHSNALPVSARLTPSTRAVAGHTQTLQMTPSLTVISHITAMSDVFCLGEASVVITNDTSSSLGFRHGIVCSLPASLWPRIGLKYAHRIQ